MPLGNMKPCQIIAGALMPDPNNFILVNRGLTFMLIPKVANTSIKMSFLKACGLDVCYPQLNHVVASAVANRHVFRIATGNEISKSQDLKIAFVRHPLDRIVSCYKDKVVRRTHQAFERIGINHGISFEAFINIIKDIPDDKADQHFRSQYHDLYYNDNLIPDYVGKFETLNADWKKVQKLVSDRCNTELPDLPHVNKTPVMDIDIPLYLADRIKRRYANDYEAFGYD